MYGLCIAERYYLIGKCRIEYFDDMKKLEAARGQLDQGVTTWILGQPAPKRRVLQAS